MRSRERLTRALRTARAAGVAVTRADRLRGDRRADVSLNALAAWPRWPALDAEARERVWRIAALVAARDALPDVIDGATLRAYAAAIGETAFETVLELPAGGAAPLPPATSLAEAGRRLAESALPAPLADALQVELIASPAAADAVANAERIAA